MRGIRHMAHSGSYVMVIGTDMHARAEAGDSDTTNEDNKEEMRRAYDLGFSCTKRSEIAQLGCG